MRPKEDGLPRGALWALLGALCYSAYIVFLRRKIDTEDKLDVPMFFGFVGKIFYCKPVLADPVHFDRIRPLKKTGSGSRILDPT
jgi:drug/metabolite transporter (DMT)-like permease